MNFLAIRFFTGQIVARGQPVVVPDKEAQLLFTIAAAQPAICADRIVERLWPDVDGDAAHNSFHVCLYRLRRHLDAGPLVKHVGRNYILCDEIDVDLQRVRQHLDTALRATNITEHYFRQISAGRAARDALGGWFDTFNATVVEALAACTHRLCDDALAEHDFRRAAGYAAELLHELPDDEWCVRVLALCNTPVTVAGA
ncbi:MAG TPA: hypothetical protein VFL13_09405 [Candidatus Baltobacteraceae bacterium]|nr:hypothetical protein [Candidatus Baltobacteraceae bacterium]